LPAIALSVIIAGLIYSQYDYTSISICFGRRQQIGLYELKYLLSHDHPFTLNHDGRASIVKNGTVIRRLRCPSGGIYSVQVIDANTIRITCSVHDDPQSHRFGQLYHLDRSKNASLLEGELAPWK
jgi:hypothetical protein